MISKLRRNRIAYRSQNSDLPISYEIIGDIGIIRIFSNNLSTPMELKHLSISLMKSHKNIKTVLFQSGAIEGIFRLRKLIYISGEKKTHTIHREHNCLFLVDVEKCYFSPRLSYERKRVSSEIKKKEIIVNMFAGVGSFSIIIVKRIESAKVYSIDLNPLAINFMKRNIRLNRVYNKIIPLLGDAKMIIDNTLQGIAD
ncbi:class I SAM-dependent methyltransferase family protein, partial [Candidatus Bathyarchaeota archaeon]